MTENRLGRETSPYLLQHKDNPVHWWPWGEAALAEAKATGKPILLSAGYAACHWCHVMAHECFEDAGVAAVMNDHFVNIKLDREERPDIDAIYMGALHRLGQQGGWPLTMFLDADARPFWGGTYFPKEARYGRPGFVTVLEEIARIVREEPAKVAANAAALTASLKARPAIGTSGARLDAWTPLAGQVCVSLVNAFDQENGGLKGAPKFPQWNMLWLMWRGGLQLGAPGARDAVLLTLRKMCEGGIYDHLGGGFARYSVDERWLVPHFEKMLYDNALLIDLLVEAYRETGEAVFAQRITETCDWLLREMVADGGGFAASYDADSEGEEGKYYVWSLAEVTQLLGAGDASLFAEVYDVTAAGNFEGHAILNRLRFDGALSDADANALGVMRGKLLARRNGRVKPGYDDKVLADWNGLAIAALARAARVLDRPDWLEAARRAFDFVTGAMMRNGRLNHAARLGRTSAPGTASDYANMIWAALRLFEAAPEPRYLATAKALQDALDQHYWVEESGGYATSADDTADVIVRLASATDDATPNANAIAAANLAALWLVTGADHYRARGEALLAAYSAETLRNPVAHCGLIAGAMSLEAPQAIVVTAGAGRDALVACLNSIGVPGAVELVIGEASGEGRTALTEGKTAVGGRAAAYVCLGAQCSAPMLEAEGLREAVRTNRGVAWDS